jgi:hypothetical protein
MIPLTRVLAAAAAMLLIIGSGLVYGLWTGRWDPPTATPTDVKERLTSIPADLGDWQGEDVESDTRGASPVLGRLERRYRNTRTNQIVSVSLVCGKPGPICIHTPDVCYGSSGFNVGENKKHTAASLGGAEFWTADALKKKSTDQTRLRIFWAWNGGDGWQAAGNPRLAYVRYPVLYKLYLIRELNAAGDALDDDPCLELFQQLQAELQRALFAPSS